MTLTIGGVFEDRRKTRTCATTYWSHWRKRTTEASWPGSAATTNLCAFVPRRHARNPASGRRPDATKNTSSPSLQNAGVDRLAFFLKPIKGSFGEANIRNMTVMLAILAFALLFTAVMNYIPDCDLGDREP